MVGGRAKPPGEGAGGRSWGDRRPPQDERAPVAGVRPRRWPLWTAAATADNEERVVNGRVLRLTEDWQWSVQCIGGPDYLGELRLRPAQIDRLVRPRMRPGALVIMEFVDDLWRVTDVSYMTQEALEAAACHVALPAASARGDEWAHAAQRALRGLERHLGGVCGGEPERAAQFAWRWLNNTSDVAG